MDIAAKIRGYLKETGRTQTYLSRETGLSETAVSQTLAGKRHLRLEEYCSICRALHVKPGFFLQ